MKWTSFLRWVWWKRKSLVKIQYLLKNVWKRKRRRDFVTLKELKSIAKRLATYVTMDKAMRTRILILRACITYSNFAFIVESYTLYATGLTWNALTNQSTILLSTTNGVMPAEGYTRATHNLSKVSYSLAWTTHVSSWISFRSYIIGKIDSKIVNSKSMIDIFHEGFCLFSRTIREMSIMIYNFFPKLTKTTSF